MPSIPRSSPRDRPTARIYRGETRRGGLRRPTAGPNAIGRSALPRPASRRSAGRLRRGARSASLTIPKNFGLENRPKLKPLHRVGRVDLAAGPGCRVDSPGGSRLNRRRQREAEPRSRAPSRVRGAPQEVRPTPAVEPGCLAPGGSARRPHEDIVAKLTVVAGVSRMARPQAGNSPVHGGTGPRRLPAPRVPHLARSRRPLRPSPRGPRSSRGAEPTRPDRTARPGIAGRAWRRVRASGADPPRAARGGDAGPDRASGHDVRRIRGAEGERRMGPGIAQDGRTEAGTAPSLPARRRPSRATLDRDRGGSAPSIRASPRRAAAASGPSSSTSPTWPCCWRSSTSYQHRGARRSRGTRSRHW